MTEENIALIGTPSYVELDGYGTRSATNGIEAINDGDDSTYYLRKCSTGAYGEDYFYTRWTVDWELKVELKRIRIAVRVFGTDGSDWNSRIVSIDAKINDVWEVVNGQIIISSENVIIEEDPTVIDVTGPWSEVSAVRVNLRSRGQGGQYVANLCAHAVHEFSAFFDPVPLYVYTDSKKEIISNSQSPLRIYDGSRVIGIALGEIGEPGDSNVRIAAGENIKTIICRDAP